jgi:hypothetical protein
VRRLAALAVVAVAALGSLLLACSDKQQEPFRDAPRGETNDEPADVFTMPDGFSNGASKCDHGNRVYVVFHGNSSYGSIDVVPQDPTCPQPTGQD